MVVSGSSNGYSVNMAVSSDGTRDFGTYRFTCALINVRERSGRGAAGSSLTSVTALLPLSKKHLS